MKCLPWSEISPCFDIMGCLLKIVFFVIGLYKCIIITFCNKFCASRGLTMNSAAFLFDKWLNKKADDSLVL